MSEINKTRRYIRTDDIGERLRFYAPAGDLNECWNWSASTAQGYGVISLKGGVTKGAHIVAWELHHRTAVPDGLVIRHTCDNRLCTNPNHLQAGTQAENVQDAVLRSNMNQGELNGGAKLSIDEVRQIKQLYETGDFTHDALALKFGVSRGAISSIMSGRRWRRIDA